jgi:hypothetical protein
MYIPTGMLIVLVECECIPDRLKSPDGTQQYTGFGMERLVRKPAIRIAPVGAPALEPGKPERIAQRKHQEPYPFGDRTVVEPAADRMGAGALIPMDPGCYHDTGSVLHRSRRGKREDRKLVSACRPVAVNEKPPMPRRSFH